MREKNIVLDRKGVTLLLEALTRMREGFRRDVVVSVAVVSRSDGYRLVPLAARPLSYDDLPVDVDDGGSGSLDDATLNYLG